MALEVGTFLDDLVTSNPVGATDDIKKGDDHLRLIKSVLKTTFPNATKAFRFETVLTKTTTYPVVAADARALILADASGGIFTITLPLGSTVFAGYSVIIMKSDSGSDVVTVDGNGAETINGSATRSLSKQYQAEKYAWDGSEWKVVAGDLVNDSVTFAKMQNITTARLLGRTTAASGDTEEIAVDGTMDLSSLTLGVKDAGIDTTQLAASAVETAKINANAVTLAKLEHGTTGDILYYGASGEPLRLAKGTDGMLLKQASGLPSWATVVNGFDTALFHIRDEKTSGSDGGTFTKDVWQKRTLDDTETNEISGASATASVITLPAGTYWVEASAPSHKVELNKLRFRNTTDNATEVVGMSVQGPTSGDSGGSVAMLSGRFTIAGAKSFELQHQCSATKTTTGFGEGAGFGEVEVYADVQIWKVG